MHVMEMGRLFFHMLCVKVLFTVSCRMKCE